MLWHPACVLQTLTFETCINQINTQAHTHTNTHILSLPQLHNSKRPKQFNVEEEMETTYYLLHKWIYNTIVQLEGYRKLFFNQLKMLTVTVLLLTVSAAAWLVATHPGRGALLAAVADNHPAGDFVALHHFPHAGAQLPYVSAASSHRCCLAMRSSPIECAAQQRRC